jgi:hypothetical protein
MSRYEMVETRCIFCNEGIGRALGGCTDGERHCHFCKAPESHAADPCLPSHDHQFRSGHEFQRVPV